MNLEKLRNEATNRGTLSGASSYFYARLLGDRLRSQVVADGMSAALFDRLARLTASHGEAWFAHGGRMRCRDVESAARCLSLFCDTWGIYCDRRACQTLHLGD